MNDSATHEVVVEIARNSYGRLIAYLASRSGDVAGAEDALSEAFVAALQKWPQDGLPEKPEAWLMHVARNRVIDMSRRDRVRENAQDELTRIANEAEAVAVREEHFPDERLKLLFVCAHPAIDAAARTPLMLQTVLGLDAARIASAFLVSPAAMGQRLVRAKNKIRDAAIPFRIPDASEWNERVSFVLDAIYSAYTTGWDSLMDESSLHRALSVEAISIGRALVELMPGEPEARGLLSLMLHCQARSAARYTTTGEFVPLDRQDTARWSRPLIEEAEKNLRAAASKKVMGRYQLEAAIQSIHAERDAGGFINWPLILQLYEGLVAISGGIGSLVGRAVALGESSRLAGGLAALDEIPAGRIVDYQPYWAARGHLLRLLGRKAEARETFTRAASLIDDPALRDYLLKRAAECGDA